ncbi:MAG TPA: beta-N-acetylglucosaminidase domain-containing protein, partial [Longimicrobiaceae bacterium]|nr:beta-N-acetylglucosaminidase domain-containing protein [Longimicrobiaceae bacterium]
MDVELGIIEGFYGKPWTWHEREETIASLAPHGYRFYLYAPKADAFMRRRWQEPYPAEQAERLAALAAHCRSLGVRFGVGLSPYELYLGFDDAAKHSLAEKLALFDEIGADDVALLFDDMRGDVPALAERQAEITAWVAERTGASRLFVCPSYYSDDPVLDRVFGQRPAGYLERLGELVDPAVEMFWTGEEVVSRAYSGRHLERVA